MHVCCSGPCVVITGHYCICYPQMLLLGLRSTCRGIVTFSPAALPSHATAIRASVRPSVGVYGSLPPSHKNGSSFFSVFCDPLNTCRVIGPSRVSHCCTGDGCHQFRWASINRLNSEHETYFQRHVIYRERESKSK